MPNYTKLKKQIENLQKILWHDAMQVDLTKAISKRKKEQ